MACSFSLSLAYHVDHQCNCTQDWGPETEVQGMSRANARIFAGWGPGHEGKLTVPTPRDRGINLTNTLACGGYVHCHTPATGATDVFALVCFCHLRSSALTGHEPISNSKCSGGLGVWLLWLASHTVGPGSYLDRQLLPTTSQCCSSCDPSSLT